MRKEAILEIILKAIDNVSKPLGEIARHFSGLGGAAVDMQLVAGKAFDVVSDAVGGLVAAVMVSVDAAANFEEKMANVNAVMNLTKDQYAKLTDEVLRLGRETIFTADEAAEAIEALARGGATFEQIMKGAGQATLDLASATKSGMKETASIMLGVMNQFQILPEHVSHAADVIAGAVNTSNMKLTDFNYAMKASGTLAAEMGLSLEDVSAGLAMFGRAGLVGESAGTGLKVMMMNLVPKTEKAAAVFEKFGFIVNGQNQFFDAHTGKLKSTVDVYKLLSEKLGAVDTPEKVAAMREMFGQRSQVVTEMLVGMRDGGAKIEEFYNILNGSSAADIASRRLDSLRGSQERLSGEWETAKIVLGDAFLPLIRRATDFAEGMLSKMQPLIKAVAEFIGWLLSPPNIEKFIDQFLGLFNLDTNKFMQGIKPFQDFLAGLANGDKTMGDKKLLGEFDIDTTPAKNSLAGLKPAISGVLDNLFGKGTGEQVFGMIDDLKKLGEQFMSLVRSANEAGAISSTITVISGAISAAVAIVDGFRDAWNGFHDAFAAAGLLFDTIGQVINDFVTGISTKATEIAAGIALWVATFQANLAQIVSDVQAKWEEIKSSIATKLTEIGADISAKWAAFLTEIQTKGQAILSDIQAKWDEIKQSIADTLNLIWNEIKLKWDAFLREISDKMKAILGEITKKWDEIKSKISDALANILSTAKAKFQELLDSARQKFEEIKNAVVSKMTELKDQAIARAQELLDSARQRWDQMVADVRQKYEELKASAIAKINELKDQAIAKATELKDKVVGLWETLKSETSRKWEELKARAKAALDSLLGAIPSWASEIATKALELGKSLVEGLWQGVLNMTGWLMEKISGWVAGLIGGTHEAGGGGSPWRKMMPVGAFAAMGFAVGFAAQWSQQESGITTAVRGTMKRIAEVTAEQMDMLKSPFSGENGLDFERARALRKAGMDMNRTGRGGFVAASSRNYYDVWSRRFGMKTVPPGMPTFEDAPPTRYGQLPPPGAGGPKPPTTPPVIPPMTVNISMEADGLVVGKWTKVTTPRIGRRADRWTFTG